ncbi:glycosyltransferase family 2 protein [Ktedonosporobacter rubrisoli]|uniref:Glycosyltransferase family 2 protein n=1 Tax=Ktedonosporobacter rubrisoli TaxID=2509675 RepID=A0A4P6K1M9_KTERU|nr:glycosyltransferase family 2 protein [Ktedonosporobacter rubrisoli]QBD81752.1 glycosyltransferase family 2 protein [Ktedonosporobacter rubrisoli]
MASPTVSIVIITCNRAFLLRHCLERVLAQPYPYKEIIVVDSSRGEESAQIVAGYPELLYVHLWGQRNNMPQARNKGIELSSGDIIAFIDDDSMVQPGWLETLLSVYEDKTVGAAGGRIITMPEPYSEQKAGPPQLIISPTGNVLARDTGLVSEAVLEIDHLVGCNMSFRRTVLEQVGGFDPTYTLTNLREETDLCVRVKRAGWRIIFHPAMAVLHFSARSLQPYFLEKPLVQFSNGRNGTYFAIKHFGLRPQTLLGLCKDAGRSCARAAYFAGLFGFGALAHLTGRLVGLGVGIRWLLSKKQRALSAPVLPLRRQAASDSSSLSVSLKNK